MKAKKSFAARTYRATANLIEPLLPRSFVTPAHCLSRKLTHRLEAEHSMIMSMIDRGKTAVDVGANIGVYTYGFLDRGANVVAIEPQAGCAAMISAFYDAGFPRSRRRGALDLHIEALGDAPGTATLHVPLKGGKIDDESASLVHHEGESLSVGVPVRRLDDYGLDNVQVIKMDVEGHELSALAGAQKTIRRWQPSILVEIEQRHHQEPIASVFARIDSIVGPGYRTSFLGTDGNLRALAEFDVQRHQLALQDNPLSRQYVRNFFILPR
jgi:FkbM family methyltransferase